METAPLLAAACTACDCPLEDWGAHGLVCPRCDAEEQAGPDREHFARGYREGERDSVAGMPRALVAAEGDEPSVVKAEDSAYYHGYKAAVEGKALDEAGAWSAYVAKHAMRANAAFRMVTAGEVGTLPIGTLLWTSQSSQGWVVVPGGIAPIALLTERAGGRVPEGAPAGTISPNFELVREGNGRVPTHGTAQRYVIAWYQGRRATPNPLHLKLEGSYSVGIGTADDKAMRSNASYESGWGGPGNYGLTDGEIGRAASRIAGSEELFRRWQSAVESERMATAGEIVADACGAPVRNVDAPAMAKVAREIARLRSGTRTKEPAMKTNARGMYADTGLEAGDYVLRSHRGNVYVDRVDDGGTHTTIGPTRGYDRVRDALKAAAYDSHREGNQHGLVAVQTDDGYPQVGNIVDGRFQPGGSDTVESVEAYVQKSLYRNAGSWTARQEQDFNDGWDDGYRLQEEPDGAPRSTEYRAGWLAGMAADRDATTVEELHSRRAFDLATISGSRSGHMPNARKNINARGMRSNAKGDVVWEDTLLTWVSTGEDKRGDPIGLNMVPTAEGRVMARDMLEERQTSHFRSSPLSQEADFLEAALGNGWSTVAPQDIGALTDATIVSMDGFMGDDGRWYPHPDVERPVVYAHMNYAVEDPVEMWAEGKPVFWTADVLEMTAEQRALAREELSSAMGESYEANMRGSGKVIESKRWRNTRTGATASPYGAVPWSGAPGDAEFDWELETVGWTIRWDDGTVGTGQMPDRTRAEAQARLDRIMGLRPGHRPNARKNVTAVIDAFAEGRRHSEKTCSTDGRVIYSYKMPIAVRGFGGDGIYVLDKDESPSGTTSSHVNAVRSAFPDAAIVNESTMLDLVELPVDDDDFEPNARKNVSAVIDAFAEGRRHSEKTCSTDGSRVYSYSMLIAARVDADGEPTKGPGRVLVLDTRESPTVTTSGQINAVRAAFRDAEVVTKFPHGAVYLPNRWYEPLDLARVTNILGADHVAQILAMEHPAAYASSRAAGWWDANDPEKFEAYKSLARMIEDGKLDDLIAETRKAR